MAAPNDRRHPDAVIRRPGRGTDLDPVKLRKLRERRLLSQARLAERAGATPDMISKVERGDRSPSPALLGKLCAALNCKPDDLLR